MSSTQSRRMNSAVLKADLDAEVTLEALMDYKPANEAFSLVKVKTALSAMQAAQAAELRARADEDAARDAAAAAEWCFHEAMLGAKAQVIAQYGESSDQLQSLGMKKKSEYKRAAREKKSKPA